MPHQDWRSPASRPLDGRAAHLLGGRTQCAADCLPSARFLHLLQHRVELASEIVERGLVRGLGHLGRRLFGFAVGHTLESTGRLTNPKSRYWPGALSATGGDYVGVAVPRLATTCRHPPRSVAAPCTEREVVGRRVAGGSGGFWT